MTTQTRQELFDYMDQEHDVLLLETGMEEIENIILKDYKEKLIKKIKKMGYKRFGRVILDLDDIIELIEANETLSHKTEIRQ